VDEGHGCCPLRKGKGRIKRLGGGNGQGREARERGCRRKKTKIGGDRREIAAKEVTGRGEIHGVAAEQEVAVGDGKGFCGLNILKRWKHHSKYGAGEKYAPEQGINSGRCSARLSAGRDVNIDRCLILIRFGSRSDGSR